MNLSSAPVVSVRELLRKSPMIGLAGLEPAVR